MLSNENEDRKRKERVDEERKRSVASRRVSCDRSNSLAHLGDLWISSFPIRHLLLLRYTIVSFSSRMIVIAFETSLFPNILDPSPSCFVVLLMKGLRGADGMKSRFPSY